METHNTDWSIFCGKISWLVFAVATFVNEICTAYLRPLQRQQGGAEFTMGCYRSLKIVLLHKVYVSSYRCYMQMFSVLYSVCIIAIPSSVTTQCHTPILLNSQDTCFEAVDWQLACPPPDIPKVHVWKTQLNLQHSWKVPWFKKQS